MADRSEFETTVMPHLGAVYRAARALCGMEEQTEDLVQATYLKALERFELFQAGTNCKAWLMKILRNTWIDELRHRQVVGPEISVDEVPLAQPARQKETVWSNAGDVLDNFEDEDVIAALKQLHEDQRLTLFLVDIEQLPHEEVAQIMDVAVGTVKSRSSRARSALKERLFAHAKDLGLVERER